MASAGTRARTCACPVITASSVPAILFARTQPQEHLWYELREKYFHNIVFDIEDHLLAALRDLENSPDRVKSISAWGLNLNY